MSGHSAEAFACLDFERGRHRSSSDVDENVSEDVKLLIQILLMTFNHWLIKAPVRAERKRMFLSATPVPAGVTANRA